MGEHRWTWAALLLAICLFTLVFTWLAHDRLKTFSSYDPRDEAVNNQILYKTAHGELLRSTIKGDQFLHMHFRPIFLPLAAAYIFHGGPTTFYFCVALILALGALAIFALAGDLFGDRRLALLAGLAWLGFAPLHELALGNFDPETLAATLWLAAFVAFRRRLARPFWLFSILALTCKETQAPVLAAFGVLGLIEKRKWTWNLLPIVIGSAWFVIALKLIIPLYHPTFDTIYGRFVGVTSTDFWGDFLASWRADPGLMLAKIFSREHLYLLGMILLAGGSLALLSPLTLIPAAPIVLEILLLADPLPVRQAHILAGIVPFIFIAGLLGIARLAGWIKSRRNQISAALMLMLLVLAAILLFQPGPFGEGRTYGKESYLPTTLFDARWYEVTPEDQAAWAMIRRIKPEAPAMTNERYLLALSSRRELYEFGNQGPDLEAYMSVDWILLGLTEPRCPTCTYARLTPESLRTAAELIRSSRFTVESAAEHVLLLRRATVAGDEVEPTKSLEITTRLDALAEEKERLRNEE
ncbi:MAG: DUF2079 domain-containing protein [Alphaproteobacteria bacterium]